MKKGANVLLPEFLDFARDRSPACTWELWADAEQRRPSMLCTWPADKLLPDVAAEIDAFASNDADTRGPARWTYCVYAKDGDKLVAQLRIVRAGNTYDVESPAAHAASGEGLVRMAMAHSEAAQRLTIAASAQLWARQERLTAVLEKRLEEMEERELAAIKIIYDHATQKLAGELAVARENRTTALLSEALTSARVMGAPILRRMLTGEDGDLPAAAELHGLDALFSSLGDEQIEKLMGILKPDQLIAVSEFMRRAVARAKENAPAAVATPAAQNGSTAS